MTRVSQYFHRQQIDIALAVAEAVLCDADARLFKGSLSVARCSLLASKLQRIQKALLSADHNV